MYCTSRYPLIKLWLHYRESYFFLKETYILIRYIISQTEHANDLSLNSWLLLLRLAYNRHD